MVVNKLNYQNIFIENKYFGADQLWYKSELKRLSGCGPTTASTITMYEKRKIDNKIYDSKEEVLKLMEIMWKYITPGIRGVDTLEKFIQGFENYLQNEEKKTLKSNVLRIDISDKPSYSEVFNFINTAITQDHPLAFLNLDNGEEKNLEAWHWVIVTGVMYDEKTQNLRIDMTDGKYEAQNIDLGLWLNTTKKNGGFIYFC